MSVRFAHLPLVSILCLPFFCAGCVERKMRLRTEPAGAVAIVNDEVVGVTPTSTSFVWYGDYDLIFRKKGFETLKTNHRLQPPWFQWPLIDLFTEMLIPITFRDEQNLPVFALQPAETPLIADVVDRAMSLRAEALAATTQPAPTATQPAEPLPPAPPPPGRSNEATPQMIPMTPVR